MDIKDLVSVEEAAKILGYEKSSVTLLCRKGKLEGAFRIGHQWMIAPSSRITRKLRRASRLCGRLGVKLRKHSLRQN